MTDHSEVTLDDAEELARKLRVVLTEAEFDRMAPELLCSASQLTTALGLFNLTQGVVSRYETELADSMRVIFRNRRLGVQRSIAAALIMDNVVLPQVLSLLDHAESLAV